MQHQHRLADVRVNLFISNRYYVISWQNMALMSRFVSKPRQTCRIRSCHLDLTGWQEGEPPEQWRSPLN